MKLIDKLANMNYIYHLYWKNMYMVFNFQLLIQHILVLKLYVQILHMSGINISLLLFSNVLFNQKCYYKLVKNGLTVSI